MTVDAARAVHHRDTIARLLHRLTDANLNELARRADQPCEADGYTPNLIGPPGTAELTTVEAAADTRAFGHTPYDTVGVWIHEAFDLLAQAATLADRIDRRCQIALTVADKRRGRESTVQLCINCNKPALPRPRASRCEPCYRYRLDHQGMDRPRHLWDRTGR